MSDVALAGVPMPGDWRARARCRELATSAGTTFFPGRGEDTSVAVAICRRCPVRAECLDYALRCGCDLVGIWGGTTARQRRELRARRGEPAPPPPPAPPVPSQVPAGTLLQTLERLLDHPGAWARVTHYASSHSASSMASNLRHGLRPTPPGRWAFEGRRSEDGGSDLYACYLGPS